jgi:hypothetical protein
MILLEGCGGVRIVFYRRSHGRFRGAECIGIERRQGVPVLSRGNGPASGRPVPGVAAGITRLMTTWQLDRQRLASITAITARGIPIAGISTSPESSAAG